MFGPSQSSFEPDNAPALNSWAAGESGHLRELAHALGPLTAISNYLDQLPVAYLQAVSSISRQLGRLGESTIQSVVIPVAAHEEHETLLQTLLNYRYQTLPADQFEIALLLNYPVGSSPAPSLTALDRWHALGPSPIKVSSAICEVEDNTSIGYLRKLLNDAVLHRVLERGLAMDHLLLRSDADTVGLHSAHLEQHLHLHRTRSQRMLAVKGKVVWDPKALASDPLSAWGVIVWNVAERLLAANGSGPLVGGVNFSLRASSYASIGGYSPTLSLGEDVDLGRRVAQLGSALMLRQPIILGGPKSACATSARRIVALREFGDPPVEQWNSPSVGFGVRNPKIRNLAIPEPLSRERFTEVISHPEFGFSAAEASARTIKFLSTMYNLRARMHGALETWLGLKFGDEVFPGVPRIENPEKIRHILLDWYDKYSGRNWKM